MTILLKYISFERFPRETLADIDNLAENIKKVDPEQGEVIHEFIECPINLDNGICKEIKLDNFHKKCEIIRKAYRFDVEDCDPADGIMDDLRKLKISLFLLLKPLQANNLKKLEKSCLK